MSFWNPKDGDEALGFAFLMVVISLAIFCASEGIGKGIGLANGTYKECTHEQLDEENK